MTNRILYYAVAGEIKFIDLFIEWYTWACRQEAQLNSRNKNTDVIFYT